MSNGTTSDSITNPVYVSLHQGTNQNLSQLTQAGTQNFSSLIQQLTIANASMVASLNSIATAITGVLPHLIGTFGNLGVGTGGTTVAQPGILAGGFPLFTPMNIAAANQIAGGSMYVSSITPGVGFNISSDSGTGSGTEIFSYFIVNPL